MLIDSKLFDKKNNGIAAGTLCRYYNDLDEAQTKLNTIPWSKRGMASFKAPRYTSTGVYRIDELTK
mgnify:FL=1